VPLAARSLEQPAGLIWTLAATDFKARYQPTIGGFVWALMRPVAMFLVLVAVFSFLFGSDPSYRFNLIIGLFLWDFFAEATKVGLISLHAKGYLLNKVHFPTWILVVSSASNALITLAVFTVIIVVFLTVSGRAPGPVAMGLFVWYLLHYVLIVAGFSLGASVLFLRYRDLNQVWDLATQAGFFVAPIVYPLAIVPERYHLYLYAWPPTAIIQFSRAVLVDGTIPSARAHLLLSVATALAVALGLFVHRRGAPRAAEYV
jgi:lipopolysaccharide transport system permease protein